MHPYSNTSNKNPLLSTSLTNTVPFYDDIDQAAEFENHHIPRTYSFKDSITSSLSNLSLRHLLPDHVVKPRLLLSRARSSISRLHSQIQILPFQSNNYDSSRMIPKSVTAGGNILSHLGKDSMTSTNHSRSRGRLNRDAPIVHYNGQNQTLESLTAEKLVWIRTEPANAGFFLKKNPLIDYHDSIVLRKPLRLSNIDSIQHRDTLKPKAMFYLRIVQTFLIDSSKSRLLRCIVTVDDHTYFTSYVQSSRSGKNSSVTEFDETFLIDIEHPTTMTVGLYYAHNKGLLRRKQSCANLSSPQIPWQPQRQQADVCLGYATIDIDLKARAKSAERLLLDNHNEVDESSSSNNCQQLLVVHGIYLSQRIQDYLHNSVLHSDYITIQVRHGYTSHYHNYGQKKKWVRFWGVLRGIQLELYHKSYKENQPPFYIIPFYYFISTLLHQDTTIEQQEGIVLQFADGALDENEFVTRMKEQEAKTRKQYSYQQPSAPMEEDLDYRIYMLADSIDAKQLWEDRIIYVGSIFDELRGWNFDEDDEDDESEPSSHGSDIHGHEAKMTGASYTSSIYEEELEGKDMTVPLDLLW